MPTQRDPFIVRRDKALTSLNGFSMEDENRRTEFQRVAQSILNDGPDGYFVLGDCRYFIELETSNKDWRLRDLNRIVTRHREDRPIRDARRWAQFALLLALIALASSLVSAIADLPGAHDNILHWTGH